jgi:hypothetical protein
MYLPGGGIMAGRSGDTFKKRQKEVARAEKHREKLAKRLERKHQARQGPETDEGSLAGQQSEDAPQSEESGASQSV